MVVTFRYRLLPTKVQHRALEHILETQRQLYNAALEERIGAYRKVGKTITYLDQSKSLTEWRNEDAEARALPVRLQRATLKRLDEAFGGYFRRVKAGSKPGFPRFRGKGHFNAFGFREFSGITLQDKYLRFKGMAGRLRVHWHRELPGSSIKSCTFKRDLSGWRVAFAIEVASGEPRKTRRAVGVDLGISIFAALSDGGFIPSLKAARRAERRLRIAQRALDAIAMEKLNIKGLARSALAKDVRDASWARFISMVRYKAEWAGARVIEVDSQYTTQDCSACGLFVPKELGTRDHDCPRCGLSIDRDLNAARNILNRAGVGPGLPNVADQGMRAGENFGWNPQRAETRGYETESLPENAT